MSEAADWTTPEYLANIAADELGSALDAHGIGFTTCFGDEDGFVSLSFDSVRGAEAMLTLAVDGTGGPGSLYDRASASCVTLSHLAQQGADVPDEQVEAAIKAGWVWTMHPAMLGRMTAWHVSVDIPTADANQVTANLNTLRHGGAL